MPAVCQAEDFALSDYGGDGFSGGAAIGLKLANSGTADCLLPGSPTIVWLDGAGQLLPSKMVDIPPTPELLISAGRPIYITIVTYAVPNGNEGAPCDPPAATLRLTLPAGGGDLTLTGPFRACGGGQVRIQSLSTTPDPIIHH
jgi:hypothetical protein